MDYIKISPLLVVFAVTATMASPAVRGSETHPVVYADDFENGFEHWQTTDLDPAMRSVWKIAKVAGSNGQMTSALRVIGPSDYQPPHRSPLSIALLKETQVGDFELSVKLQSTNVKAGSHRDLCIFWGYQDPEHFYYVHLGAKSDRNACQIFIVDGGPRRPITVKQAKGTPWTAGCTTCELCVARRQASSKSISTTWKICTWPLRTPRSNGAKWGLAHLTTTAIGMTSRSVEFQSTRKQ